MEAMPSKRDALHRADPAGPNFKLADSPLYWLARVAGRYRLDMDMVLKPIGMDVPRWRVLAILTEHEPASVTEVRLTDAGRDAAVSVHAQASRIFYHGFDGFSAAEVAALNGMLQRLFTNFGLPPR